jgi:hypothetical protein
MLKTAPKRLKMIYKTNRKPPTQQIPCHYKPIHQRNCATCGKNDVCIEKDKIIPDCNICPNKNECVAT